MTNTNTIYSEKRTNNAIITKILELCNERSWSLYKLAKETEIPYSSLNNMIKRNTLPTIPTLFKICKGFNVAPADFLFSVHYSFSSDIKYLPVSHDEIELLTSYRKLDDDTKSLVISYINEQISNKS